ncbi:calcium-translocating p-type pmca-type family protein [Stylonychia lemnae]|uniref:P-type Ca(2+) transporter n=1 Tax=Stylonychia lemnae TaxID=5949 RepID=A0A078AJD9_STYLE|nr:calcium-translocating p-type pmca-type family protein [Stylonychia lemnae]|eukprot:CDW82450.1 calcium-translocating p-type pmca-type family protein [Stylonychia lemnae]
MIEPLKDKLIIILLIAALFSTVIGVIQNPSLGWLDGASIFFSVAIIVIVTTINNYAQELKFQKLVAKAAVDYVAVYRGGYGVTKTIPVIELVVGDIYQINQGMRIPADSILLEGIDVQCDESAMTGENESVIKTHVSLQNFQSNPDPFLISKTLVVNGLGKALVCAVGINSRSGMVEEKLNTVTSETPLQKKLGTLGNQLGKIGVICALTIIIAGIGNFIIRRFIDSSIGWFGNEELTSSSLEELTSIVILAITLIVVVVPEGLPLAVTLSFAFSVMKMKKENNLVRNLQSSEIMGGVNEICTDKTGTLTTNQMTIREFYAQEQVYIGRPSNFNQMSISKLIKEGIIYNSNARIEKQDNGELQAFGNRAFTAIRHPEDPNLVRVFCKGAPEVVLKLISKQIDKDGSVTQISTLKKDEINAKIVNETFAKRAFRTIMLAYRDYSFQEFDRIKEQNNNFQSEQDREALENELTLVSIFALQDPLRDEIVQSIKICYQAGVNVRMVTGDNLETAKAIALEAGILRQEDQDDEYACLDGKMFREACGGMTKIETENGLIKEEIVNGEIFKKIAKRLKVLARSTPEDKYMLVTGLRDLGSVVAVTGDGTNDAPALKKADVGFSMGICGTEVAKEASDIILLDDNFASIITALKWGRNIFSNVRKFLQLQIVISAVAGSIVSIASIALPSHSPPINSIEMLWINLLMDTLAALSLATEQPNDHLLDKMPYTRDESIISPFMWRNIFSHSIYQFVILLVILFAGQSMFITIGPYDNGMYLYEDGVPTVKARHFTYLFHTFVMLQLFNQINARKIEPQEMNVFKGIFQNYYFLVLWAISFIFQILLVQFGGQVFKTCPLNIQEHLICIAIGTTSLLFGMNFNLTLLGLFVKKFVPLHWFTRIVIKQEALSDEEEKSSITAMLRKSYRQSVEYQKQQIDNFNKSQSIRVLAKNFRKNQSMSIHAEKLDLKSISMNLGKDRRIDYSQANKDISPTSINSRKLRLLH